MYRYCVYVSLSLSMYVYIYIICIHWRAYIYIYIYIYNVHAGREALLAVAGQKLSALGARRLRVRPVVTVAVVTVCRSYEQLESLTSIPIHIHVYVYVYVMYMYIMNIRISNDLVYLGCMWDEVRPQATQSRGTFSHSCHICIYIYIYTYLQGVRCSTLWLSALYVEIPWTRQAKLCGPWNSRQPSDQQTFPLVQNHLLSRLRMDALQGRWPGNR